MNDVQIEACEEALNSIYYGNWEEGVSELANGNCTVEHFETIINTPQSYFECGINERDLAYCPKLIMSARDWVNLEKDIDRYLSDKTDTACKKALRGLYYGNTSYAVQILANAGCSVLTLRNFMEKPMAYIECGIKSEHLALEPSLEISNEDWATIQKDIEKYLSTEVAS